MKVSNNLLGVPQKLLASQSFGVGLSGLALFCKKTNAASSSKELSRILVFCNRSSSIALHPSRKKILWVFYCFNHQ